jgi:hypothetical protein
MCQEFSGKHNIFTQMMAADFELLIILVALKNVKRNTKLQAADSSSSLIGSKNATVGHRPLVQLSVVLTLLVQGAESFFRS